MILSTQTRRHVYISLLLLGAFAYNFAHRDGWKEAQGPGDEPGYIKAAYDGWHSGRGSLEVGGITWSPGYVALMSPFVAVFGKDTGYKLWRFALFGGVTLLVYFNFSQMFDSAWFGVWMALYSQLFLMPYASPSLQSLAALLYLICFRLLASKRRFLGIAFALLLNGIFVSGPISFVTASFATLCLVFYPKLVLSKRFVIQVSAGVALFGFFLHHYRYDILAYPKEAAARGRAGLYHQLSLYILTSGRTLPYFQNGSVPADSTSNVDEYHRQLHAIEAYYLDKWGETENDLRAYRHDQRWPLLFLDWPWMMTKDPQLMREYRHEVFKTMGSSMSYAFQVILPFGDYDINTRSFKRGMYVVPLIFVLILPEVVRLVQRKTSSVKVMWPSGLQMLFLLSCVMSLVPLMLVNPLPIYFPPLIPAYLMCIGLLSSSILVAAEKAVPVFEEKINPALGKLFPALKKVRLSRSGPRRRGPFGTIS